MVRGVLPSRTVIGVALLLGGVVCAAELGRAPAVELPKVPELRARNHLLSLTLRAALNSEGKNSFFFEGRPTAPTLRLEPGDRLNITYVNDLPVEPQESCAIPPCMDMSNLHFHGLTVSPNAPQDDVLDMMAAPGQSLSYSVEIPKDHAPGLYWYHTHPHGESHRQVLDGMSGALVVEGLESYVPEIAELREQILVIRGRSIEHDPQGKAWLSRVETGAPCGESHEAVEEVFTVNGVLRPELNVGPGERQFWRVVNASPDRYVDLQLEGRSFEIVAMDGMPIARHDPSHRTRIADHVLLPPAGRVEAIVTGPSAATAGRLISRCVDTGPDGDPNPAMTLADIAPKRGGVPASAKTQLMPQVKGLNLEAEEKAPPRFVVRFTEDKNGFYINQKKFAADAAPMVSAKVGGYQHWKIINDTKELHPMHIHQVHFLAFAENDQPLRDPVWLDTANVPYGGSADVIMDFTDPVIRGMSVFHCHLLNHEDKGMMAKILFE